MHTLSRPAILITAAVAAATIASPVFAAESITNTPTSLNARASKLVEPPRHTDTVLLTLRSRHAGVAGEDSKFLVRSRRDTSTARWSSWHAVAAVPGAVTGRYRVKVTMPAKIRKGAMEQYQVKFAGDTTRHLAPSRSQVLTITAS